MKCSATLFDDIAKHGGRPVMSAVGHSIIKDRMKLEGALLACEMSGHIFYKERWLCFDDAMYVTARLVEILSHAWGLVRASNTQPVIVLRAEASTPEALARIRGEIESFVAAHA